MSVTSIPRSILIGLVRFYRVAISPLSPPTCRFTPTCSEYTIQALRRYGAVKGIILSAHRLIRCNPWGGQGYDPPRWYGEPADIVEEHNEDDRRDASEPPVESEYQPS